MEGNSRMNPYTKRWETSEDINSQSAPSNVPVISVDLPSLVSLGKELCKHLGSV